MNASAQHLPSRPLTPGPCIRVARSGGSSRVGLCCQHADRCEPQALAALLDGRAAGAEDGQEGGGARIVMLWPEERHVFRYRATPGAQVGNLRNTQIFPQQRKTLSISEINNPAGNRYPPSPWPLGVSCPLWGEEAQRTTGFRVEG